MGVKVVQNGRGRFNIGGDGSTWMKVVQRESEDVCLTLHLAAFNMGVRVVQHGNGDGSTWKESRFNMIPGRI
jgi:hypothetical protein